MKLGTNAGANSGNDNISIGWQSGTNSGTGTISIGSGAGINGGNGSISIGLNSSANNNNSIVINSTGTTTVSTEDNACFINPIRNVAASSVVSPYIIQYSDISKELFKSEDLSIRDIACRDIDISGTLTNIGTASLFNGQLTIGGNNMIVGAANNVLVVDLANQRVGIKNGSPQEILDVAGNIMLSGTLKCNSITPTSELDIIGNLDVDGDISCNDISCNDISCSSISINGLEPFTPAYAYFQIDVSQTLAPSGRPSGSGYIEIDFGKEILNDSLVTQTNDDLFTFNQTGLYKIETTIWVLNTTSTLLRLDNTIRLNSNDIATGQVMVQNSQADDLAGVTVDCFVVTPIQANDTLEIVAYFTSTSGITYIPTFDISLGEGSTKLFISKLR